MTVNKHLYITEPFKHETLTKYWFKVRYQDRPNVCLMLGLRRTLVIAVKYYHILTIYTQQTWDVEPMLF